MAERETREDIEKKLRKKRSKELAAYFGEFVRREGLFAAVKRTGYYLKRRYGKKSGRFLPKKETLEKQRAMDTTGWPKLSVVVPVYEPDIAFFEALLDSVLEQSYGSFELVLADGSKDKTSVEELVIKKADSRITLLAVDNLGISCNTNAAAERATGEYIVFADHDDVLSPNALFEMAQTARETGATLLYSDEALFTDDIKNPSAGHFKPDYAPHYLMSVNYIGHLVAVKRDLFEEIGGLREGFDGAQDHDFLLRALEKTGGAVHIPKVLYYWRQHAASTSTGTEAKPYVTAAAKKAIGEHLERTGVKGHAEEGFFPSTYHVVYELQNEPLISLVIPSYEHVDDLDRCLASVYNKTGYRNFEVVVVENNSKREETFSYYDTLPEKYPDCRVVRYPGSFNFSKVCNFGRNLARGEYLLFLNNDTEVTSPGWLQEMLGICSQPDVGAVGGMLYYPDDTVQHAGVIVGLGGYAGHSHKYAFRGKSGYMFRQAVVQDLSAVTAACVLVKADVFDEVKGFDETLAVAYNDVDLCLRIRKAGYSVVFTPYAELYHYESKSRGSDEEGTAKERADTERALLKKRYGEELLQDPFYNPNLTYDREDFSENDVLPEV